MCSITGWMRSYCSSRVRPPSREDNQTRVHLDVEEPDKIACVACNDDKVIFESVVPDFRVRFPGQTDKSYPYVPLEFATGESVVIDRVRLASRIAQLAVEKIGPP